MNTPLLGVFTGGVKSLPPDGTPSGIFTPGTPMANDAGFEALTSKRDYDALKKQLAAEPLARKLTAIPGIGPISALNLALRIDATQFKSGRHLAAWLGLVPRERSTGGKQRLGGISRAGNERLRQLLVVGATAVIQYAKPDRPGVSPWLLELLKRLIDNRPPYDPNCTSKRTDHSSL